MSSTSSDHAHITHGVVHRATNSNADQSRAHTSAPILNAAVHDSREEPLLPFSQPLRELSPALQAGSHSCLAQQNIPADTVFFESTQDVRIQTDAVQGTGAHDVLFPNCNTCLYVAQIPVSSQPQLQHVRPSPSSNPPSCIPLYPHSLGSIFCPAHSPASALHSSTSANHQHFLSRLSVHHQVPCTFQQPLDPATAPIAAMAASSAQCSHGFPTSHISTDAFANTIRQVVAAVRTVFERVDDQKTGFLDFKHFLDSLQFLNVDIAFHHALDLFAKSDSNKDGHIVEQELIDAYIHILCFTPNVCDT